MKKAILAALFLAATVFSAAPSQAAPATFGQCRSNDDCFIVTVDDGCGNEKMACINTSDDMGEYRQQVAASYEKKRPDCSKAPRAVPDCSCVAKRCVPAKRAHMR